MIKLKVGDRVNCRLKASKIIKACDTEFDDEKTFEIIGVDSNGYYLFIPPYFSVKESSKIDIWIAKELSLSAKFIGEEAVFVNADFIFKIQTILDGCFCCKCHVFAEYAAPNQLDGTLICWYCQTYPSFH
jgi:hypothetical protein